MKISVVLPIFNSSMYLEECLDGIVANSENGDVEIVCVDDCSTDNSAAILERFVRKCSRIKIVQHTVNKGTNEARRSGVLAATGDYVLFADADDRFVDGAIDVIRERLAEKEPDVLFFGFRPFDCPDGISAGETEKSRYFNKVQDGHKFVANKKSALEMIYRQCRLGVMVWARAWKREVLVSGFAIIPEGWCAEQEDDCQHLAFLAFVRTVDAIDYIGYEYRYDSGVTNEGVDAKNAMRYLRNSVFIVKFIKSFKERFGEDSPYAQYLPFIEMNRQDKFEKIGMWLQSVGETEEFSSNGGLRVEMAELWRMYARDREGTRYEMFWLLNRIPMLNFAIRCRRFLLKMGMLFAKYIKQRLLIMVIHQQNLPELYHSLILIICLI